MRLRNPLSIVGCVALVLSMLAFVPALSASAAQPSDPGPANALPSAVPSASTPNVDDGRVFAIGQVGNNMIIGGSFTSVAGVSHQRVAEFNKTTGALISGFAPTVNGDVNAVIPGPVANTVYIGGSFTQVNGAAAQFLSLVNLTNGATVSTFHSPAFNYGYVNDLVLRGSKLYVAGVFTAAGGHTHQGLIAVNASTGALDASMNVQLTGHHNDSGGGAQAWVGATDFDVTADGKTMVVIGNFKYADGQLRDQIATIALSGPSAVLTSWSTDRYSPYCFNWAFDQYVRGVAFSPDGSFFAVNSTGGGNRGTLCDATVRWELTDAPNSQPTWIDENGGDTVWGITVTARAVYVGGHTRWMNNPYGGDNAQAGAVPRAGIAALDVQTGRPWAWNPGKVPLGVASFTFFGTTDGVWMGYDQDYIGNRHYRRQKVAFFPYAGGYTPASTATNALPGTVYLGGSQSGGTTNVLYRVDTGGPAIQSLDNGSDWAADTSDPSPYRNDGTNVAGYDGSETVDSTVPATTPRNLFETERWSPSDSPPMDWAFPVAAGTPLQVRLYFANRYSGTSQVGQRVFNVDLDGTRVLNNFDIVATTGDQRGTMQAFNITSDGTVNIDFSHVNENPLINGIEIVRTDITPNPTDADGLTAVDFDGTTANAATADSQGIDFGNWRGAFKVGSRVYYGYTDGFLYSRSFNGTTFGAATKIDPYNDPAWSNVTPYDGSPTLRGVVPNWYGQLTNVTGMTYYQGRVYYTLFGDSHLYSKWFLPDSSIIDETTATQSSSVDLSSADGMFVSDGSLYYGSRSDGDLRKVDFSGGNITGSATVVSGPTQDGVNWKNRAMFLGAGTPANAAPTAAFTSQCTSLRCSFDASTSGDTDGTVASYAWDFGDGTGTGATPQHTYSAAGTYNVTLIVKDNLNKSSAPVSHSVTVSNSAPTAAFSYNCSAHVCSFDASGSSDTDGTVASYSWNFGDGTGTGKTPSHTYGSAGTYTVTLTVTDDVGGTSSPVSKPVGVTDQATGVQFVGAANAGGGNTLAKQVQLPSAASAGDTAVLSLSQNSTATWTGPTGVTGWTQVDTYTNSTLITTVWVKRLSAADLGGTVRFSTTAYSHASADLAVYSGVDATTPVAAFARSGDASGTSHTTPTATAGAGDFVVSLWSSRAAATVTWTAPSGLTTRDSSTDTGSLTLQALVADANASSSAGTVGGVTATTNTSVRSSMWTLVLNAA
jgi:PKD repeat protein